MMRTLLSFIVILCALALSGCASGENAGSQSGAVQAVEGYYQALVARNDAQLSSYTCGAWEEQALLEYDSFQGVEIALDSVSCAEVGQEGEATLVECEGKIVATYGNEQMDFPLEDRVHRVVNEAGDWRMCGY